MSTKIYLSPDTFTKDCFRLARSVYDSPWQPDLILALWRGGSIPGIILCEAFRYLGRPTPHHIVKCSSYQQFDRCAMVVFDCADQVFAQITPDMRVLVVDDVFDTGKTAEAVLKHLPHADLRFAMVYWKAEASLVPIKPDYYIRETSDWIVFPHELEGLTPEEVYHKDPMIAKILDVANTSVANDCVKA